jgi:transposase-like protein
MALALAGFDAHNVAEPVLGDGRDYKRWRRQLAIADIYHDTQQYFEFSQVKQACNDAIGRLPRMQQEVIRDYFYRDLGVDEIAGRHNVKASTVYNHKAQAQKRLGDDDAWFMALWALGKVRDRVRAERLRDAPIEQRLPDGRRRIVIDEAA